MRCPVGLSGITGWPLTGFGQDDVGWHGRRTSRLVHVHRQRRIDLLPARHLPGLDSQAATNRARAPVGDRPPIIG